MTINYNVQATIHDLSTAMPGEGERFFVDTNVFYWMTYNNVSSPPLNIDQQRMGEYAHFVSLALTNKSVLHHCPLTLAELAHIIERSEADIYKIVNRLNNFSQKDFRHSRAPAVASSKKEVETAWKSVRAMSQGLDADMDDAFAIKLLHVISTQIIDPYDAAYHLLCQETGITRIISDDGDWSTVAGIALYTRNQNVLRTAQRVGRLAR